MESALSSDRQLGKNYDRATWFYDLSSALFSAGKIRASKKVAVSRLEPGERVLFLGVGSGEDAVMAANRGAHVTCIDLSQKMLELLERRLQAVGKSAELICGNAFDHQPTELYDAVAANYFLNIFYRDDMERMLVHAAGLVKPGGKFLIADVSPAQGSLPARLFNIVYLKLAMITFWLLGLVPLHRNYDYLEAFPQAQLVVEHIRTFRFLRYGPILFRTIVARRQGELAVNQATAATDPQA
ncbi:MAG: methyltransferase domain-containing protein [Pirellulaceae bacterium]|nr:methyltransferase domain-containing protein [Pirellulaceae bacterium]